jgi:hypothetical protein
MASPKPLSDDFVAAAIAERDKLVARLTETQEQERHFDTLATKAREEAAALAASIRDIEETVGLSSQIAICQISEELRGERLREVALEVLRDRAGEGDPIHYRAWFEALVESGYRVTGKDPLATFLTQVSRIDRVERIGRRSGLYRLRVAA